MTALANDAHAPDCFAFFVPGHPVAGGSKKAFPVHGRDGRLHVSVVDTSGPRGKDWRAAIRIAAHDAHPGPPLEGPLSLHLRFVLQRPASHRGARGVKPSAPPYPIVKPDVLKLARLVEDACTGLLWRDDSQVVLEELAKTYPVGGDPIGVWITVALLLAPAATLLLGEAQR